MSMPTSIFASTRAEHMYPRLANYFLKWEISAQEVVELAKWDVVVLDMEIQARAPERIHQLRELNPDIVILAYITAQEIRDDAIGGWSMMRDRLARGISPEWYLVNDQGVRYSFWPGTHMLNVSNHAPRHNGLRFNEYLAWFVAREILSSGLWDGVFYDNTWIDVTWFTGNRVDYTRNGVADTQIDAKWYEGMRTLYHNTRLLAPTMLVVGNGHTRGYASDLNGKMIENFLEHEWNYTMNTYLDNQINARNRVVNIINANTGNTGNHAMYRSMRFGLTSTLLLDGYFSFDHGDQDHSQTWWYDEYNVSLGRPMAPAQSLTRATEFTGDVWSRDFEHGLTVVNSTNRARTIPLGGEYEKIHGTQDTTINDGSIISEVTLAPRDGVVLMKTFETLKDVVFTNGFFARFFRHDGSRARNGLFVFDQDERGSAQIAHIDLNRDGERDKVAVIDNRVQAWRSDGQLWLRLFPYGANYQGGLRVAIGDLNNDGEYEIYIAPTTGFAEPIRVYSRYGNKIGSDFYPFGESYRGGYYLALTKAGYTTPARLVVGAGTGVRPTITLYGHGFDRVHSFLAFEASFTGGVSVAVGDVDGDGVQEIIAGKGPGGEPVVRIFSFDGREKYKPFTAYTSLFKPGIEVRAVDITYDGIDEIVTLSETAL